MSRPIHPPSDDPGGATMRELWHGLRRHRWLIAGSTALAMALAALAIALATPAYESVATLRIVTPERDAGLLGRLPALADVAMPGLDGNDIDTEMGVLRSRMVAEAVVDSLHLHVEVLEPRGRRAAVLRVLRAPRDAAAGIFAYQLREDGAYRLAEHEADRPLRLPERVAPGEPVEIGGVSLVLAPGPGAPPERIRFAIHPFQRMVERFREELRVDKQEGRSELVEIAYRAPDPELAAEAVNSVVATFMRHKSSTGHQDLRQRVETLQDQVADYGVQLRRAEQRLREYREQHRVLHPSEEATQQVRLLAEVRSGREQALIERQALRRLLTEIEQGGTADLSVYRRLAAFPSFLANQGVQSILETLNELEGKRSELLLLRTPQNPEVRRLDERIAALEQQLHRLATDYLQSLDSQIASADASLARFGAEVERVPERELEYARLLREQNLLNEVYLQLQTRLKEAEVQYAIAPEEVRVIDTGLAPGEPVSPRPAVMLVLAAVLGLMLGTAVAVAREAMDTRIRSPEEAEEASGGVPVVGMIPRVPLPANGRGRLSERLRVRPLLPAGGERSAGWLITRDEPGHGAAEAFRALRTSILSEEEAAAPQVLMITSAMPGEGKTLSSANLAVALAQQGNRVLLVDGDLRRGALHRVLGTSGEPGLSHVLRGEVTLERALQEVEVEGPHAARLHFVPAGPPPPDPAEMMGSARMERLLDELRGKYDRIVVDSPALQLVTDAAELGRKVDGVLLVVRAGSTDRLALQQTATRLQRMRVPVSGVILNDLGPSSPNAYVAAGGPAGAWSDG